MVARVKPLPLQDIRGLPFTLQEWMRQIANLLFSPSGLIPLTSLGTLASGKLLGRFSSGAGNVEEITVGAGLEMDGSGTLTAPGTPFQRAMAATTAQKFYGAF